MLESTYNIMIPIWIGHISILIALIIGTITDFKRREVPDFLNFSLMGVGIIIGLLNTVIESNIALLIGSIIGLVCGYLLGAFMFYTGQWGGGDAKMLMGMGAVLGINISYFWLGGEIPLYFSVVLAIFVAGSIYGLLYGIYLIIKKRVEFKNEFQKRIQEPIIRKVRIGIVIFCILCIILAITTSQLLLSWMFGFLAIIVFGGFYLVIIGKLIEKVCMVKTIKVKDLTIGEWVAKDVIINKKILISTKDLGVTQKQITELKKHKVKEIIIKEGIPFIPGFLLGYILILIYGNIIEKILLLF
jgi:Flp pilus assembly protein protease CpaA